MRQVAYASPILQIGRSFKHNVSLPSGLRVRARACSCSPQAHVLGALQVKRFRNTVVVDVAASHAKLKPVCALLLPDDAEPHSSESCSGCVVRRTPCAAKAALTSLARAQMESHAAGQGKARWQHGQQ